MDTYALVDAVAEFIKVHPQLAGYTALMLALMLTGRIRLVVLGGVMGLVGLCAYHIGLACVGGLLSPYRAAIAILVSVVVIVVTVRRTVR